MRKIWEKYDPVTRQTLGACFLAFFFNGVLTMMIGSALPDMKAAYGINDTQAGLMLSGHSAGNLIACFLSGLAPLWLGKRKSITVLSAIAAIGFLMMLASGNPIWLVVAFILTGIGRGSISNFNNGTVNLVTAGSPTAINLLHSFFAIGAISAPLLFLLANRLSGWRAAILLTVALGVTVSFNFSRLHLTNDRPDRTDHRQKSMTFLHNRTYLILGGMLFFYLCAEYAINGWLVSYLQSKPDLLARFGAEGQDAHTALVTYSQTMATLFWAIILVGRLVSAALARRVPQKLLMMLDSIGVVGFFSMLLLNSTIAMVTVAIIGLGFCMAGICPMIYSNASYITNRYPMGVSTLLAIGSVGAMLMPALVGAIADRYGFTGGMSAILFGILALLTLAILNYFLKPQAIEA